MPRSLERALRRFRPDGRPLRASASGRRGADDGDGTWARISAAEFRAATEERLRSLEREVAEVKGRINGLIFVVAGAVITQGADASPLTVIARVFYSPHMQSCLDHGSVRE